MTDKLKAPFPYFGGKSLIAPRIWEVLGNVNRYMEPFFGSGAVLLNRPDVLPGADEIICDADGYICNVWRAIQYAPEKVAEICDWPVNHADLNARRKYLVDHSAELLANVSTNPDYFNVKLAGYWVWCQSTWIGAGMTRPDAMPFLAHGLGIHSKRPHLLNKGIHASDIGNGIVERLQALSLRLRYVKVVCGDWSRICGGKWQADHAPCGVFFDPPYSDKNRKDCYTVDSYTVAHDVREWCKRWGDNPKMRIVLAGYDGEHNELENLGWRVESWKANGGYGNYTEGRGKANAQRERLWISPHCQHHQPELLLEHKS